MFDSLIVLIALVLSGAAIVLHFRPNWIRNLMPGARVAVSIYRHKESGEYIYCRTGSLQGDMHEYVGEGKIAASKAVEC
jgi:hypothetical protein